MSFSLPQLEYAYDALEPHIDARTMEIHTIKVTPISLTLQLKGPKMNQWTY